VQFNAVFPALNKSHEACSIEIKKLSKLLETSGHAAVQHDCFKIISPLSDSFRGANEWKLLGARSALYSRCVRTSQPISAIFCVFWWAVWSGTLCCWKITPCWSRISCVGIHLADSLLSLRCARIIFLAEMTLRLSSAAVLCIYLRELCWCQLYLLYSAHQCDRHHWLTDSHLRNEHSIKYTWCEHETQSALNTAANLWWKSALGLETPSATRNLITICYCCCKPKLSVKILGNNDVMIKTQGMWSTLYISQLHHSEQFLFFTLATKQYQSRKLLNNPRNSNSGNYTSYMNEQFMLCIFSCSQAQMWHHFLILWWKSCPFLMCSHCSCVVLIPVLLMSLSQLWMVYWYII